MLHGITQISTLLSPKLVHLILKQTNLMKHECGFECLTSSAFNNRYGATYKKEGYPERAL